MSRAWLAAVAGMAAAGYATGRYTAPTRVETRERIVERTVAAKEDRSEDRASTAVAHVVGTKYVIRHIERPDGTKERTQEHELIKRDEAVRTVEKVVTRVEVQWKERVVEQERIVMSAGRPNWSVTGRAGLNLEMQPVYGAGVERRILGPLSVGIWADSSKTIGGSLRWEF